MRSDESSSQCSRHVVVTHLESGSSAIARVVRDATHGSSPKKKKEKGLFLHVETEGALEERFILRKSAQPVLALYVTWRQTII